MSKGKNNRTPADKAAQKGRTYRNQVRKYKKLIDENPGHKDVKLWEKNIEFYDGALKQLA